MPPKISRRCCDHCGKYYESTNIRFCSRGCGVAYRRANKQSVPSRRTGRVINCTHCGKAIYRQKGDIKKYKLLFCSDACRKTYRECGETRTCPLCGDTFYVSPCHLAANWAKHCSPKCRQKAKELTNVVICPVCGEPFYQFPCERKEGRKYCSKECWSIAIGAGTKEYYYGPNWYAQARKARKRDKICQRCGKTRKENGRKLDAHHIIPFKEFGLERYEEANVLDNLICYCQSCHKEVEIELWAKNHINGQGQPIS